MKVFLTFTIVEVEKITHYVFLTEIGPHPQEKKPKNIDLISNYVFTYNGGKVIRR